MYKIESSFIDQLLFKFSKLQDTLGENIFRGILNRLEELKVIEKDKWLQLREIRNEIAHEYSFNQDEVVDSINLIYDKSSELIEIYEGVLRFRKSKFAL